MTNEEPSPANVMALLNRKVDYALLILCSLHHSAVGGCARALAGQFGLSRAFVANILKDLCQKGFVRSQRGVKGGYLVREGTAGRSLAELIDALDEKVRLAECTDSDPEACCRLAPQCPIHAPIEEVHRRLRAVLEQVTLREIFEHSGGAVVESLQLDVTRCEKSIVPAEA